MKNWLINLASSVGVGTAFIAASQIDSFGWGWLAYAAAIGLLQALFVQKYPKQEALKWAVRLRKGQRVHVDLEGK